MEAYQVVDCLCAERVYEVDDHLQNEHDYEDGRHSGCPLRHDFNQ